MSCPSENQSQIDQSKFWDSDGIHWTPHRIGWAIAGGCAALTVLISTISVLSHCRNYTNRSQQRQILRILYMPPVYAVISFASYRFFRSYTYYSFIQSVYEAIGLSAFLLLLIDYVGATASGGSAEKALERKDKPHPLYPLPIHMMLTTTPTSRSITGPIEWTRPTRRAPLYDGKEDLRNPEAILPRFTYACAPSRTQRYSLNRTVKYKEPRRVIEPSSISFPSDLPLPLGWEKHIHPEGLPYFVSFLPNNNLLRRIMTEEWMYDPDIAGLVSDFIRQIQDAISNCNATIWPESDLFVELQRSQGGLVQPDGNAYCGYYFVHNPSRCIYWPESVTLRDFTSKFVGDISGDLSGYQTQLCLEIEYWTHWNHFPTLYDVTPNALNYLVDTITCAMTDVISAPDNASTAFTYEQLHRMLTLIPIAKEYNTLSWYIGRFMMQLTRERFRNYFGAWGARLNRSQSVVDAQPEPRSMLMLVCSPFMFFIPHALLERAESLIVDQYFTLSQWEEFFNQLQEERKTTTINAVVVVVANCALMIGLYFHQQMVGSYNSQLQIPNYLSLTTGLSGAILGLIMCQIKWLRWSSIQVDHDIEESNSGSNFNMQLQQLTIIWSLPHVLVLWSMILLIISLLLFSFTGPFTAIKATIGISTSLFILLTFYYVVKFGIIVKLLRDWVKGVIEGLRSMIRTIMGLGKKLVKLWTRMGLINLL